MSAATTADLATLRRQVYDAMAADRRERDRLLDVERRVIAALRAEIAELRGDAVGEKRGRVAA